jgi:hypothetical protein
VGVILALGRDRPPLQLCAFPGLLVGLVDPPAMALGNTTFYDLPAWLGNSQVRDRLDRVVCRDVGRVVRGMETGLSGGVEVLCN